MPLTLASFPDPTADAILDHVYIWAAEVNFNFATQHGRIVYFIHRDEAAAYANKEPLGVIAFDLTPTGRPEVKNEIGEVIEPAFPSFMELMAQNQYAYGAVGQAVYTLLLSRPQYAVAQLIVRPEVASTVPAADAQATGIKDVKLTFNVDVDPASLQFTLLDGQSAPVSLTVTYSNKVATFSSQANLPAGTYTGTLHMAKTANKDSLPAPYSWSFTVA